jgi:hypothetical protein
VVSKPRVWVAPVPFFKLNTKKIQEVANGFEISALPRIANRTLLLFDMARLFENQQLDAVVIMCNSWYYSSISGTKIGVT